MTKSIRVPIHETNGWSCTMNLQEALANGYIGETLVTPTEVANALHWYCTGRKLPAWTQYYFGKRDERISKLFGYTDD